ncbi:hypothetical protein JW710_01335 [Candidatus Dojkabacteria bacterium]|nr:hypothetical protein [Candidatus Dojkabacteria bacterium]
MANPGLSQEGFYEARGIASSIWLQMDEKQRYEATSPFLDSDFQPTGWTQMDVLKHLVQEQQWITEKAVSRNIPFPEENIVGPEMQCPYYRTMVEIVAAPGVEEVALLSEVLVNTSALFDGVFESDHSSGTPFLWREWLQTNRLWNSLTKYGMFSFSEIDIPVFETAWIRGDDLSRFYPDKDFLVRDKEPKEPRPILTCRGDIGRTLLRRIYLMSGARNEYLIQNALRSMDTFPKMFNHHYLLWRLSCIPAITAGGDPLDYFSVDGFVRYHVLLVLPSGGLSTVEELLGTVASSQIIRLNDELRMSSSLSQLVEYSAVELDGSDDSAQIIAAVNKAIQTDAMYRKEANFKLLRDNKRSELFSSPWN